MARHHFDPANRHRLLREERYQTNPPDRVLDLLPLRPGAVVADIGCGPGFYTLPLAGRVADPQGQGLVYAIDIEPMMLDDVRQRAAAAGVANVRTVEVTPTVIPLPPASVDGAFMAFAYHEIADRAGYLAMLHGLVRPGGWLAIQEWEKRQNPVGGPPLDQRLTPVEVADELDAAGWRVTAQHVVSEWTYLLLAAGGARGVASGP